MVRLGTELRVSLRGDRNHAASARTHLRDVVKDLLVLSAGCGYANHRHAFRNKGDWTVLHLRGGKPFGVNVADLLELQGPLESDREVHAAPQVEAVGVVGVDLGDLLDLIRLIEHASDTEELARSVDDTGGVYLVPAFTGLGAPYWDPLARGTIVGLTRGSTRAHLVRATLESIAYQSRDILECFIRDTKVGAVNSSAPWLMWKQH